MDGHFDAQSTWVETVRTQSVAAAAQIENVNLDNVNRIGFLCKPYRTIGMET